MTDEGSLAGVSAPEGRSPGGQRMGTVIALAPEHVAEYRRLHAAVWPDVLARIEACRIRNYTIFPREPGNLLFGYREYHGEDFEADTLSVRSLPPVERVRWQGARARPRLL